MEEINDRHEAELFNMKEENFVLRTRLYTELDHVTKAIHELDLMQGNLKWCATVCRLSLINKH